MSAWKLTIAYDGGGFAGWAAQPGERTVQGVLEEALARILGGRRIAVTVAGRTDAGVHATGQVASFELDSEPPDRFAERVNAVLPRDVALRGVEPAPPGFDARRWARTRTYRYRLLATPLRDPLEEGRALWWPYPLDRRALRGSAEELVGEHDFTAFTPTQTEHVRFTRRVLAAEWAPESADLLAFTITADAFMRHMVRVLVGTMLEVGGGRRSLENFAALLRGAPRERAGETAQPHGLYLERIELGDGPAFAHGPHEPERGTR